MTMLYTLNQAYPYPAVDETINNMNDWVFLLAKYAEVRGVQRFLNQAELSTKRPTPSQGEFAFLQTEKTVQVYTSDGWKRVFPPAPQVLFGTAVPASSIGEVGDLYIKTT